MRAKYGHKVKTLVFSFYYEIFHSAATNTEFIGNLYAHCDIYIYITYFVDG